MDTEQKLFQSLKDYAGDDYDENQDKFLLTLIQDAIDEVCLHMYPGGFLTTEQKIKAQDKALLNYESNIRKIAEYHYDKQGIEGAISHSESGKSVSYENSGTPKSYFYGIVPCAIII